MGERRQSLDVNSEQARERVGLGVTEGMERGCDVLHGAMSLAQLHTGQGRARFDGSGGGGESVCGQCRRARRDVIAACGDLCGIPGFKVGIALASERVHSIGAGLFGKKA